MTHPVSGFLEGLMGGVQAGTQFRQNRDDRRMALGEHQQDREYEQARRLREEVAAALQQRVLESQLTQPHYTEVSPGATLHDPTGRGPDYTAPSREPAPLVQDWQREGFSTQGDWQRYHERISRAGTGADRGQVTPRDIFEKKVLLMAPHWGPDATGAIRLMPGLSEADAERAVSQAAGTYQPPPAASTFGGGLARPGTGGTAPRMPQGGRSARPATPAPTSQASTPQDRWEELVGQGMDKNAATAQVKQEFKLP